MHTNNELPTARPASFMGATMMAVNAASLPPHQPQITSDGRPRTIVKRATCALHVNVPQVGTRP